MHALIFAVVLACPSDLDGEMRTEPIFVRRFGIKPVSKIGKAHLGVLGRDSPFKGVLGELPLADIS